MATNLCDGSEAPGNLYVAFDEVNEESYVNAYGTPPIGCEPPPLDPPEIKAQFAASVDTDGATLKAQINPRFWDDTRYYVEYGTGKCSEGGCEAKHPAPPGAKLTSQVTNSSVTSAGVFLADLEPDTTYRYRFVAESSGGGPVRGVGGTPVLDGAEGSFTTFPLPTPLPACPGNAGLRTGPSASLPDCRAYEMVSPPEKNGGDAAPWLGRTGLAPMLFEVHQSALSGDRFTFTSSTPFADPETSVFAPQYLSNRDPKGGWSTASISPPHSAPPVLPITLLSGEFKGFSDDLCSAWVRHYSQAPLAPGAITGFANLYQRDNCASPGSYEALSTAEPSNRAADKYEELNPLGSSADGSHTIFVANGELHEDAPSLKEGQISLYEHSPEGLRYVCYLPNGSPSPKACSAGTAARAGNALSIQSSARNAISADGQRIFWSASAPETSPESRQPGQIFVRVSGAETFKVSGLISTEPAWHWTAADDGSKAVFEFMSGPLKDSLYEVDVDKSIAEEPEAARLIAKGTLGPMGFSEDASHIYFASKEDLASGASEGANNLYLYEEPEEESTEGTYAFIAALADDDIDTTSITEGAPVEDVPTQRLARVSPDGQHATFPSFASLTGYDNLDAVTGNPAQEVYLYDAEEDELRCVSCNPSGARPTGENIATAGGSRWAAARLQGWEALQHAPRVLSDDGTRVYFESFEALVPRDTNGAWDVYQWEEPGTGSCTEADSTYGEASGGCVDLISSGQSPEDSVFLDADPTGKNAFFSTQSSLLPQDTGLSDVYVARVGGGFPQPTPVPGCEGEACQGPLSAPDDPTPASSSFEGSGNVTEAPRPTKCAKGRRAIRKAGRTRCIKKPSRKQKKAKRANTKRRAAR